MRCRRSSQLVPLQTTCGFLWGVCTVLTRTELWEIDNNDALRLDARRSPRSFASVSKIWQAMYSLNSQGLLVPCTGALGALRCGLRLERAMELPITVNLTRFHRPYQRSCFTAAAQRNFVLLHDYGRLCCDFC
ncbi:hypothetical protein BDV98DRAFT_283712 [Pterulicium gracile]|uniref:Uncharacterized protein n=1 Tax=Pterulicium gracile TaxID=1884261 RepID=A0A5C3QXG9_9AGAR|nr:hypothetical protein BDV98DRAFT_283712 [Pterula gracilis]